MIIIGFVSIVRGIVAKKLPPKLKFHFFKNFYPPLCIFKTLVW